MAREAKTINSPVSAQGQISSRAPYMRPGRDNTNSKALRSAFAQINQGLGAAQKGVDNYQTAQLQAADITEQRQLTRDIQKASAEGGMAALRGESKDAFSDHRPEVKAAWQEAHAEANILRRLQSLETNMDMDAFKADVDAGLDKADAFMLGNFETMLEGYDPVVQSQMMPILSQWAGSKRSEIIQGNKEARIEMLATDTVDAAIGALKASGGNPDAFMGIVEMNSELYRAMGGEGDGAWKVSIAETASRLTGDPSILNALTDDADFMKTLGVSDRQALLDARDAATAKADALANAVEARELKAFKNGYGRQLLQAYSIGQNDPAAGAQMVEGLRRSALSYAESNPALAEQMIALGDRAEKLFLEPPAEKAKGPELAQARLMLVQSMAKATSQDEAFDALISYSEATGDDSTWAATQMLNWGDDEVKIDSHDGYVSARALTLSAGKSVMSATPQGSSLYNDRDVVFGGSIMQQASALTSQRMRGNAVGVRHEDYVQQLGGYQGVYANYVSTFQQAFTEVWNQTGAGEEVSNLGDVEVRKWWEGALRDPIIGPALAATSDGQRFVEMKASSGTLDPSAFAD